MIWISAPAGAGKTILVSTYLEDRGIPCLWYQVDIGDDDPATLFYYLGEAALAAVPKARKTFPVVTLEYLLNLPTFTLKYVEDLCSHLATSPSRSRETKHADKPGFAPVFDNCQEVPETSTCHSITLNGLARIHSEFSVIFISRISPPPAYTRLQANEQMSLIGWDDMRLSPLETHRIICLRTTEAPPQETIDHIHRVKDVWVMSQSLTVD